MDPADEMAAKIEAALRRSGGAVAGSDDLFRKFDERVRVTKDLQRSSDQSNPPEDLRSSQRISNQRTPVEDSPSIVGINDQLDPESLAHGPIYNRLRPIAHYLVAICVGVAATLAWQSYENVAPKAPATPSIDPEQLRQINQAYENVAFKAPGPPSIDPEQLRQIKQDLAAIRQTVEQIQSKQFSKDTEERAAAQDQTAGAPPDESPRPKRRGRRRH